MSAAPSMDLRHPLGGLFVALGLILAGYGFATRDTVEMYARSTSVNINLWWGVIMLVFGVVLVLMAGRARRIAAARPALETPEGRATEEREHNLGLEQ